MDPGDEQEAQIDYPLRPTDKSPEELSRWDQYRRIYISSMHTFDRQTKESWKSLVGKQGTLQPAPKAMGFKCHPIAGDFLKAGGELNWAHIAMLKALDSERLRASNLLRGAVLKKYPGVDWPLKESYDFNESYRHPKSARRASETINSDTIRVSQDPNMNSNTGTKSLRESVSSFRGQSPDEIYLPETDEEYGDYNHEGDDECNDPGPTRKRQRVISPESPREEPLAEAPSPMDTLPRASLRPCSAENAVFAQQDCSKAPRPLNPDGILNRHMALAQEQNQFYTHLLANAKEDAKIYCAISERLDALENERQPRKDQDIAALRMDIKALGQKLSLSMKDFNERIEHIEERLHKHDEERFLNEERFLRWIEGRLPELLEETEALKLIRSESANTSAGMAILAMKQKEQERELHHYTSGLRAAFRPRNIDSQVYEEQSFLY